MILVLKMKTEIFNSFLDTRQPIWNWEILEYEWIELSDKSVHFLFNKTCRRTEQLAWDAFPFWSILESYIHSYQHDSDQTKALQQLTL